MKKSDKHEDKSKENKKVTKEDLKKASGGRRGKDPFSDTLTRREPTNRNDRFTR